MFFPYTGNSILDRRISAAFHVLFCFFKFPVLSAMLMHRIFFKLLNFSGLYSQFLHVLPPYYRTIAHCKMVTIKNLAYSCIGVDSFKKSIQNGKVFF